MDSTGNPTGSFQERSILRVKSLTAYDEGSMQKNGMTTKGLKPNIITDASFFTWRDLIGDLFEEI